jgi:hypothetical protein
LYEIIGEKLAPAINDMSAGLVTLLGDTGKLLKSDAVSGWEKFWAIFDMSGTGYAMDDTLKKIKAIEDADVNMNVPQWYTDMMDKMARDAEVRTAAIKNRMAQILSGPSSMQGKGFTGQLQSGSLGPEMGWETYTDDKGNRRIREAPKKLGFREITGIDLDGFKDDSQMFYELSSGLNAAMNDISMGLVNSLGEAGTALDGFLRTLLSTVLKMITILMSQSLANAIAGATQSGLATGPAAIFTTPGFIATAVGGVMAAFGKLAMPALAEGGLAYGPTAAIVGDNPRASVDPEVIAPLSKLQGLTGGNVNVHGKFVLEGDKLVAAVRKYNNRYSGTNGGKAI